MTFTRAAAAEMRERIQAAIEKKLESEPENEHLQQQAVLVQFTQITTIDSFCLHIMRGTFLTGWTSIRHSGSAMRGEMLLMRADVMDGLLEDYYRDGGKRYEEFVDAYATGKADGGIAEYVMQVYNFAQSNPWPDAWYEKKCREELLLTEQGELEQTGGCSSFCVILHCRRRSGKYSFGRRGRSARDGGTDAVPADDRGRSAPCGGSLRGSRFV